MTEAEWLVSEDPRPMLSLLTRTPEQATAAGAIGVPRPLAKLRKLRLFACGCTRTVWHLLTDEHNRQAVEVSERYADGRATRAELQAAADAKVDTKNIAAVAAFVCAFDKSYPPPNKANCMMVSNIREVVPLATQAALMRCIFGNPFRPVTLDSAWLAWNGGTVRQLAEAIYNEHAFDRMPILADALEDAGCQDEQVLEHCRGQEPHVRGCWCVDLLLKKS
jgi:hypothetical protein